jgi:hypothetical protein
MTRVSSTALLRGLLFSAVLGTCFVGFAVSQQGPNTYPQQFVGIWRAQYQGRDFLLLNLHEEAVQLAGTIRRAEVHIDLAGSGDVDNVRGDLNEPVRLRQVGIKGQDLFFVLTEPGGQTTQWRMEVTSPGRANLQLLTLPQGQHANPIAIVRESIFGPAPPPAASRSTELPADLHQFIGEWKTEYQGHAFLTLVLREEGGKLVGACQHSRSINWDKRGQLTIVSEELADDEIVSATAAGKTLSLVIGNSDDPDDPVKIALTLTSADEAQGVLLGLPPDVSKQRPWLFRRTATH